VNNLNETKLINTITISCPELKQVGELLEKVCGNLYRFKSNIFISFEGKNENNL